nr:hypothetical protein [Flavobacterium sp.]
TSSTILLKVPADVITKWQLKSGDFRLKDQLHGSSYLMRIENGVGLIKLTVKPSESLILKLDY